MYTAKLKKKRSHIQKSTVFIILGALLLLVVGGVFAKYVWNNDEKNLISAKEFYFTSNLLSVDTQKYVLNSTATEVSFLLGNNADKLRYSQDDIKYTVTIECKTGDSTAKLEKNGGTLEGDQISQEKIKIERLEKGKTYIVTAVGEAGYQQTLSAEFTVSDKDENVYKYLDTSNDAYVLLTVWTNNVSGDLTVKVNKNGLIPDNTDPILRKVYNYKNGNYGAFEFKDEGNYKTAYSSYTYRFFVKDKNGFSVDDFDIYIEKDSATYQSVAAIPK